MKYSDVQQCGEVQCILQFSTSRSSSLVGGGSSSLTEDEVCFSVIVVRKRLLLSTSGEGMGSVMSSRFVSKEVFVKYINYISLEMKFIFHYFGFA